MQLYCDNNICVDAAVSDTTYFHQTTTANSTENVYYIILNSLPIIIYIMLLRVLIRLNFNILAVMQRVSWTVSSEIQTIINIPK